MATYNLGRVGLVTRGDYSSTISYSALDVVTYNGTGYIAKSAVTGVAPTNTTYWMQALQLTGTNTNDATAYASNIQQGYTAYARGSKITGTMVASSGINTSDATAVASDIKSGKTAYVNGLKINGSLPTYTGTTTVPPGLSAQTLYTAGYYMPYNVTVPAQQGL